MKIIPFILMLSLCVTCAFGQTHKGVYVENGKTVEIDKKVRRFTPTNSNEILYFSNELIAKVYTDSDFTIDNFFQEVNNTNKTPEKAKFGEHNFASTLMNGTMIVTYSGGDSNSSCVISTPMTDIELHKGTFYFKVTENKVLVFVLDGSLKSYGDKKKENVVTAGYAVVANPNDVGILEDKISLGAEKVKPLVIDKLKEEAKDVINLKGTTLFSIIDGKIVGIVIN